LISAAAGTAIVVMTYFPIVFVASNSLKSGQDIFSSGVFSLFTQFDYENYVTAWSGVSHQQLNTVIVAALSIVIGVSAAALGAYAFSQLRFRGKNLLFLAYVALLATAYWAHDAALMAEIAAAIGRPGDAAEYRALRAKIGDAFAAAYVAGDGRVSSGTQTAYTLAQRAAAAPETGAGQRVVDVGGPAPIPSGPLAAHEPSSLSTQAATSATLPSGSARVHQPGACSSLTRWPPAAIAAATRACPWSSGTETSMWNRFWPARGSLTSWNQNDGPLARGS
jgi:hypothetical protein